MTLTGFTLMMMWLSWPIPPSSSLLDELNSSDLAMAYQLMKIAFPEAKEGKCLTELPHPVDRNKTDIFHLEALACTSLGSDWMVLVANANVTNDNQPYKSHPATGLLNLIWFKKDKGDWIRASHEMNIHSIGSWGDMGKVRFHPFPGGRLVLSMEPFYGGNGYKEGYLDLFELIPDKSRDLCPDGEIGAWFDNSLTCDKEFYAIKGEWSFAQTASPGSDPDYPDLLFQFKGNKLSCRREDPKIAPCCEEPDWEIIAPIQGQAVYVYSQGSYRLKSGTNPVEKTMQGGHL